MNSAGGMIDVGNGQRRISFPPGSLTGLKAGTQIAAKTSQGHQVILGTVVNLGDQVSVL